MRKFMAIAKALADGNRVRILMFLRHGELCLCQVIEILGLAPSTVSKHMTVLYQSGLIETRKEGRWIYYRLSKEDCPCTRGALQWLKEALRGDEKIGNDDKKIKALRKVPKEELCAHYKKR